MAFRFFVRFSIFQISKSRKIAFLSCWRDDIYILATTRSMHTISTEFLFTRYIYFDASKTTTCWTSKSLHHLQNIRKNICVVESVWNVRMKSADLLIRSDIFVTCCDFFLFSWSVKVICSMGNRSKWMSEIVIRAHETNIYTNIHIKCWCVVAIKKITGKR